MKLYIVKSRHKTDKCWTGMSIYRQEENAIKDMESMTKYGNIYQHEDIEVKMIVRYIETKDGDFGLY